MDTFSVLKRDPTVLLVIGGLGLGIGIPLMVLTHMFRSGTPDPKDPSYNSYIMSVCGKDKFINSVLTYGYIKASIRRFCNDWRVALSCPPRVSLGSRAVDCKLVDINGKPLSLLRDYIEKMPRGMPLVLNMGSYT